MQLVRQKHFAPSQSPVQAIVGAFCFSKPKSKPMPYAPPKVCCHVSCARTTHARFCDVHAAEHQRNYDQRRGSSTERGYNARWQRESKRFLTRPENVLCVCGCGRPSTVVDHKHPHKGDQQLFWDQSNWQGMTKRCHDSKTAREDGRWGHRPPS